MSSSWDFCLSPQYQVTLFFYFFLIKSQQWRYLTLTRSQLNPRLNLWRCGTHSNLLSIQPLTPLGPVDLIAQVEELAADEVNEKAGAARRSVFPQG